MFSITFIMHELSGGNIFSFIEKCVQLIKDLFCNAHFLLESESAHSTQR